MIMDNFIILEAITLGIGIILIAVVRRKMKHQTHVSK